jgi:glycosyltransferase involved in cell wall biosynthesis
MRIAQIAPLFEAVPPKTYGGTERVVSWLTDALTELGHEVTLFASSDSYTSARLMPAETRSLRLDKREGEHLAYHYLMLEQVVSMASEFDIFHGHLDYLSFPVLRANDLTSVHTLHGRLDLPHLRSLFDEYKDMPLISIAGHQRKPQLQANWKATIHHGLPANLYNFQPKPEGDYLVFLGRICPDKGVDKAIQIAHQCGMHLKIAAKVDVVDEKYYREVIAPLIEVHDVEFIGEADDEQKNKLLGNARAMLFPIDWEEPFGLVLIEAMACGTPVIAFNRGSVPEILVNGENGFICDGLKDACKALDNLDSIDRAQCRHHFDTRFTSIHMAQNYVRVYEEILMARDSKKILYFSNARNHIQPAIPRELEMAKSLTD